MRIAQDWLSNYYVSYPRRTASPCRLDQNGIPMPFGSGWHTRSVPACFVAKNAELAYDLSIRLVIEDSLLIGTTLQNRYRIDAELGRGGMGVVYRVHDMLLDRDVAIKMLSVAGLGSEGRARLLREAQAAARLNHPNIVSVHDAGEVDQAPFIVMELVEGESLHTRRPQALDEALAIARQVCAALDHAHAHGIIHRDLKPENVLITPDGVAKLMDFGLARSSLLSLPGRGAGGEGQRLTGEGAIVGTVFYLAPEQALGQAIDGRADLYALGVMLYELTTGRLPFTADDPLAIISQHIHTPAAPPRAVRPDLPPALESIILRLLAKNPADRFGSAREVIEALAAGSQPGIPPLPTGTVALLFSDISDYKVWAPNPDAPAALARHDAILRATIVQHGGRVLKVVHDTFMAVFAAPEQAVAAALAVQRRLAAEDWGTIGSLRVRLGLHAGPVEMRGDDDYLPGPTLAHALRLMSIGHGGQILLSQSIAVLARDRLPGDARLKDLGAYILPDATEPERFFQIVTPDLPQDFPPLAARAAVHHNLPAQLTSFIGREKEITEIKQLLTPTPGPSPSPVVGHQGRGWGGVAGVGVRLLTLTGSGGTGKTRLALQVAADVLESYSDGVWLVELASLSDSNLVSQTVASVLGVREEPNYPLSKALADYLRPKSLLLILDNCEHLVDACAQLAETLLRACPNVKILASSREALGIAGETIFRVPSLSLPAPRIRRLPPVEALAQYESIRLFIDRAVTVRPGFRLTEANAPAVSHICYRLDGVPLAIELAAARMSAMTAEQIAARLDDRFRLLTGGSRTALPRQQTLRALIDWSWDLLSDAERALLRRLAVFVGGWTLEAAEAVVSDNAKRSVNGKPLITDGVSLNTEDILDLLTHLVDKSLVVMEEQVDEMRYRLLETIRQYARDKLLEAGESEQARARHLDFFLQLSEEAEPQLRATDQLAWLARLETEHDNLRAALQWSLGSEEIEAGLRLAGNLARFWYLRGYWNEGREWLNLMLSPSGGDAALPESMARARAKALRGAGWLADEDGSEIALYTESLALSRQIGDRWGEAFSLRGMVSGLPNWDNPEHVLPRLQESLALFRELRDAWGVGLANYNLGWLALNQDESQQAEATWDEGLQLFRQSGDRWGIAVSLNALGYVARLRGNYPRATALTQEGLALFRELGDKAGIALSLTRLGNVAFRRGDYVEATALLEESLAVQRERGGQAGIVDSLYLLGLVACYQGDYPRAVAALEQSLALARESDDLYRIFYVLNALAFVAYYRNDIERAATLWQESLVMEQEEGHATDSVAYSLYGLGLVAQRRGDTALALQRLTGSLVLYRASEDKRYIAIVLHSLGRLAQDQGDRARAAAHLKESLILRKKTGAKRGIAESLEAVAGMTTQAEQAARLFGMAEALRESIGAPLPPVERADYDRSAAAVRAALGEAAFAAAWAEGRATKLEQAIGAALEALNEG